jgi:hypothetical protein
LRSIGFVLFLCCALHRLATDELIIVCLFSVTICSILADLSLRFRWLVLQLAELEECSSQYEIETQLAELPEGLDEIYIRILKNINKKHHADTRMFLQWLAFCKRPMKIEEIAETITVDFSGEFPVFNRDKRYADTRDVLVRCSSFVSESEGKYSWLNPAFCALNSEYRCH